MIICTARSRLFVKIIALFWFQTVSGLFTTRKWATFYAKTAHFLSANHRVILSVSQGCIFRWARVRLNISTCMAAVCCICVCLPLRAGFVCMLVIAYTMLPAE